MLETLAAHETANSSYGRAAKLLAIYLKAIVVLAGAHATPFGRLLHPPIDAIPPRQLSADAAYPSDPRDTWRNLRWTQLEVDDYFQLIGALRAAGVDQPAFWAIERYWEATG